MIRIATIALCFTLFWSSMINIGLVAWYELEKGYIASELCENRFVEDSDCEGHCVLQKKIQDTRPTDKFVPEARFPVYLIPCSCIGQLSPFRKELVEPAVCSPVLDGYPHNVFHPPKFVNQPTAS